MHVPHKDLVGARHGVHAYIAATSDVLTDPKKSTHALPISGNALSELLVTRREYRSKKYRVVGSPKVLSERVVKRSLKPPRLVLAVCVDNSAIKVLDKHGRRVSSPPSASRVLNLFTLDRDKTHWVVSNTGFPPNPLC